jgi:UDP-N-acetylmuramoyl-L-alanyl-D-glutamate--2,6-diaminopimelate ligase
MSLAPLPTPRALAPALRGLTQLPEALRVSDITLDSRAVRPGAAFLACAGGTRHGLEFAQRAAAAGAAVILWESVPGLRLPALDASILVREVPGLHEQLGTIADRFYEAPSARLRIDAITGTNGKTTCAWLLAQALSQLGHRSAYLGTLGVGTFSAGTAEQLCTLTLTTPDVVTLHRLLAQLLADGADSVALEVSSHALEQRRCAGVRLHAAAFTNLTRDHLDYHADMAAYGAAKARLLDWPDLAARIINVDDAFGESLARQWLHAQPFLTSRQAPAPWFASLPHVPYVCARSVAVSRDGLCLSVQTRDAEAQLTSALRGAFNADNLLTVLALLLSRAVPLEQACAALARCQPPPGRMQPEGGGALPLVLIDYAHTPDALAQALTAARALCTGRLWCIFGCGGERDRGKRAQMGRIAATLADRLIVTDDNPRAEDPRQIVSQILSGVAQAGGEPRTRVLHDRAAAIASGIAGAAQGDVVLLAGKGHEDYQLVGAERLPFSDTACVRSALASRGRA